MKRLLNLTFSLRPLHFQEVQVRNPPEREPLSEAGVAVVHQVRLRARGRRLRRRQQLGGAELRGAPPLGLQVRFRDLMKNSLNLGTTFSFQRALPPRGHLGARRLGRLLLRLHDDLRRQERPRQPRRVGGRRPRRGRAGPVRAGAHRLGGGGGGRAEEARGH